MYKAIGIGTADQASIVLALQLALEEKVEVLMIEENTSLKELHESVHKIDISEAYVPVAIERPQHRWGKRYRRHNKY